MPTKKILSLLTVLFLLCSLTETAHGALIDRGGGLIYDEDLNITWLKDANTAKTSGYDANGMMTGYEANDWIASLNSANYKGYNDWRLPKTLPVNGVSYDYSTSYDGSTDRGYNITSPNSEMAYMFYVELGNLGYRDTSGNYPQPGWGLTNTGPFDNLQPDMYWSDTEYLGPNYNVWYFHLNNGLQNGEEKASYGMFAWAVRSGDVDVAAVPEPGTLFLLGTGLSGMFALKNKKRTRRLHLSADRQVDDHG